MPKKSLKSTAIDESFFDTKTNELTRTFFAIRLTVFFIVLPLLDLLWTRATYTDVSIEITLTSNISDRSLAGLTALSVTLRSLMQHSLKTLQLTRKNFQAQ